MSTTQDYFLESYSGTRRIAISASSEDISRSFTGPIAGIGLNITANTGTVAFEGRTSKR